MELTPLRIVKPVLVALVAFGAVFWLTGDTAAASVFALLPLLLGWLGIMESVAYGLAALALLIAVAMAILPPSTRDELTRTVEDARAKLTSAAKE